MFEISPVVVVVGLGVVGLGVPVTLVATRVASEMGVVRIDRATIRSSGSIGVAGMAIDGS
jgi:hypothetical protein